MSKELEALKEIYNGMYNKQGFINEFKTIEQALTPPTQEEVCEAIMKHYRGKVVFYNEMARTFNEVHITRNEETVSFYANGEVGINYNGLPPHLITLIGRFYEGMEKK